MTRSNVSLPIAVALGLAVAAAPGGAFAQDAAAGAAQSGPRKDPNGVTGISPFWESIKKGDDAYVIRDFDAALAAYKEALASDPKNPLGHYRLGSVYSAKGNLDEAQASWETANRFAANQPEVKAKTLFVLADLAERRRKLDAAVAGWSGYEGHAKANPEVKTYPATPPERKKRISEWEQLESQYASVKARIAKRLSEANEKQRKSAK